MVTPHKGDRSAFYIRVPTPVADQVRMRAKEVGLPYNDFISAILSEYVGLSYLCPMPEKPDAGTLLAELGLTEPDLPRAG